MTLIYLLVLAVSTAIFSFIGTALLLFLLPRLNWFDVPVERSNHTAPTPRGGGIAVTFAAVSFLLASGADTHIVLGALFLGIVSLIDDVKGLAVRPRLLAQVIAIAYGTLAFTDHKIVHGIIPLWVIAPIALVGWMWFINLYNFMDGIDGITSAETVSISGGIFALGAITLTVSTGMQADAIIVAAAVMGFAYLNWHPARIFMGDVGSIPLGYIMGYMLLMLAAEGEWAAALILPAYYLSDATYTLVRRYLRGEKIWHAHSEHAYQKAVRAGRRHDEVVRWIIALNLVLIILAAVSTINLTCSIVALGLAYIACFLLMSKFASPRIDIIPPAPTMNSLPEQA